MNIFILSSTPKSEFTADSLYRYIYTDNVCAELRSILQTGEDDEIIGLILGERFPVRNEQPLIESYIDRIMERYDLILPYETTTNGRQFDASVIIGRKNVLREIFTMPLNDPGYLADNLRFSRHIRQKVQEKGFRVKSEQIAKADPQKWNAGYERIEVLRRYIDTLLAEYIGLRKQTGFEDCFADEDPYQGDFGGKIPVWICWWQGLDDAPELIKACISSLSVNISERCEPVLVTFDNWAEYVTFTSTVIDKFNAGIISYTHLADMLRTELLYRYGGMWIDATYFVSGQVPDEIFDQNFYTLAFDKPLWGMDVMKGRWSSSLLGTRHRHSPVMQFVMEGLWLYWEQMDETIDYFFWDYIFEAGYRNFTAIRQAVDAVLTSPPYVYDLQLELNQRVSVPEIERLKRESYIYKINRRGEYHKTTEHGFRTIYSYIVNLYGNDKDTDTDVDMTESGPGRIDCSSESELIRAIREVNPYRIVDMDGYFSDTGWISRGLIDDFILHDLRIEQADDVVGTPNPVVTLLVENRYRLELYDF